MNGREEGLQPLMAWFKDATQAWFDRLPPREQAQIINDMDAWDAEPQEVRDAWIAEFNEAMEE